MAESPSSALLNGDSADLPSSAEMESRVSWVVGGVVSGGVVVVGGVVTSALMTRSGGFDTTR